MPLAPNKKTEDLDVVVIGAGLSGLYAVYRLRQLGLRMRAYDQASDVGGTWWWNRYPGARVDSPGAPFYGYTFSDELAREWDWKDTQPAQTEILAYLRHVADRFNLRKDIQLNTKITVAEWEGSKDSWRLTTSRDEVIQARFLISAAGTLSASFLPNIPGAPEFAGEVVHTGHWPEAGLSFADKRVGVIGTGSSGVQVIPFIAREASEVVVFQRTPQYVIPGRNQPIDQDFASATKRNWPEHRDRIQATGRPFPTSTLRAVDVTRQEREAAYEEAWRRGGLGLALTFTDHMTDPVANGFIAEFVRSKIAAIVADPDIAEKLMPTFLFGGKRLILGEGYYETFNLQHVKLVDLRTDPIDRIEASCVRTQANSFPVDTLVYATGYDALTGAILRLDPIGQEGSLRRKWRDGVTTYLGLGVRGFPNMFMIHGPQTPSVKYHMGLGAEKQVDWIANLIIWMRQKSLDAVQPGPEMEAAWAEEVRSIANKTLFPLTDSWFSGANIPGKPREFMIHLDGPGYHQQLAQLAAANYPGFQFRGPLTACGKSIDDERGGRGPQETADTEYR